MEKRFSQGLQILSHYTFAHANKYDSTYYVNNPAVAYGPDAQVRNHVWVNNVVYELPFGKGKMFAGNSRGLEDCVHRRMADHRYYNWGSGLPWTPSTNECGSEEDVGVCRPNKVRGLSPSELGRFSIPLAGVPSDSSLHR